MKKILLSFKPFWYEKIKSGEKIFEYRSRFCNEPVIAYMYVSKPVMGITGVIKLDKRIELEDWKLQYKDNDKVYKRICDFKQRNNYAMPIIEFRDTNILSIDEIRKNVPGFAAPQMYYNLGEESVLLKFIERNIVFSNLSIYNSFEGDFTEDICRTISG